MVALDRIGPSAGALARDLEDRFQTVDELVDAFIAAAPGRRRSWSPAMAASPSSMPPSGVNEAGPPSAPSHASEAPPASGAASRSDSIQHMATMRSPAAGT